MNNKLTLLQFLELKSPNTVNPSLDFSPCSLPITLTVLLGCYNKYICVFCVLILVYVYLHESAQSNYKILF